MTKESLNGDEKCNGVLLGQDYETWERMTSLSKVVAQEV